MKIQIIIPIYNPDEKIICILNMIRRQTIKNLPVLIIDSSDNNEYKEQIEGIDGVEIVDIPQKIFDHGGTRQLGIDKKNGADIYVFFTQDAIPVDEYAVEKLISVFKNKSVGCAYGRQLPHKNADCLSRVARFINYGETDYIRFLHDKKKYGVKTAFLSNSFAAYRATMIKSVGGFPEATILGEDMYVAGRILQRGWGVAYCSKAKVYHSHNYNILQEGRRYFDIGVFHAREKWLKKEFGANEKSGIEYIKIELKLLKYRPYDMLRSIIRNSVKFFAYQMGKYEKYIPDNIKIKLSMNKKYWL